MRKRGSVECSTNLSVKFVLAGGSAYSVRQRSTRSICEALCRIIDCTFYPGVNSCSIFSGKSNPQPKYSHKRSHLQSSPDNPRQYHETWVRWKGERLRSVTQGRRRPPRGGGIVPMPPVLIGGERSARWVWCSGVGCPGVNFTLNVEMREVQRNGSGFDNPWTKESGVNS